MTIKYKSWISGIIGSAVAVAGLYYTLGNPLESGKVNLPTHYLSADVDKDGRKNDFVLGYNSDKSKEFYVETDDGFQRVDNFINSTKNNELENAVKFHDSEVADTRKRTANIKSRLRKAQTESK
tara:strand:- start:57 stop:428 length:372 start_codon:yes stop_codon:yes gene_type:complete